VRESLDVEAGEDGPAGGGGDPGPAPGHAVRRRRALAVLCGVDRLFVFLFALGFILYSFLYGR